MTANEDFLDGNLRRAIFLERYKGDLSRRVQRLLLELEVDLEARLRRSLDSFIHGRGKERSRRMASLLAFIQNKRSEDLVQVRDLLVEELGTLSEREADFQIQLADRVIPVRVDFLSPSPAQLRTLVRAGDILGDTLGGLVADLEAGDRRRILRAVRLGVASGDPTPQIVQRVLGSGPLGRGGQTARTRAAADAVVRTAVQAVANAARDEVWRANADIVAGLRWVSTLDGRTSDICRARDGDVYPIGLGPRPPAHYRCRSVMVAVFDMEALVGPRPFVRSTRGRDARELDFRRVAREQAGRDKWRTWSPGRRKDAVAAVRRRWAEENIGLAPAGTTYPVWLRKQPARFQDQVLGSTRGLLFREGGYELRDFVDLQTGRRFTHAELERATPLVFERLGLVA